MKKALMLSSNEAVEQQRTSFRQKPIIKASLKGAYIDWNFQYDKFLLQYTCVLIVIYISDIYWGGQRGTINLGEQRKLEAVESLTWLQVPGDSLSCCTKDNR